MIMTNEYIPTTEEVRDWWTGGDDGLLRQEFDRWLAEHDRQVKGEAWAEGWDVGYQYGLLMYRDYRTGNPYREVTE